MMHQARDQAVAAGTCRTDMIGCGKTLGNPVQDSFRDRVSYDEYLIVGLCQACQDEVEEAQLMNENIDDFYETDWTDSEQEN